jgi:hypothetical protein
LCVDSCESADRCESTGKITRSFGTDITGKENSCSRALDLVSERPTLSACQQEGLSSSLTNAGSKPKATAVLKVTIHLDDKNVESFDEHKLALCRKALAKAAGVPPSQVGLKLARGRVLKRAVKKPKSKQLKASADTRGQDEEDLFFDVEEGKENGVGACCV